MALQEVPEKAGDQANVEDICTEESSHVDLALDQDLQLALRLLLQQQQQPSEQQQYRLLLLISLWILKDNSLGLDTAGQCPQDANYQQNVPKTEDQDNLEDAVFKASDANPDSLAQVQEMQQAFGSQQQQLRKREQQQQRPHKHQHHLLLLCILGIL